MKKLVLGASASALVGLSLGATLAFAGAGAGSGIVGSKHDMNLIAPGSDAYNRVCAYCHTPHHALKDATVDYLPLWSKDLTTQTYQAYQSASLDAQIGDPLVGPSRLCMSCHDGQIAVDNHYGAKGNVVKTGDGYGQIAVSNGTGDLTNDHPIGFQYADVAAVDTGIRPPESAFINNPAKTIGDVLTDGYMTCATCHEVHNKDNISFGNYNFFLYAPQEQSQICVSCHDK